MERGPDPARAGFVLSGGRSSRMGRDKALLPYENTTLIQHVAGQVRIAAGTVRLVGGGNRYSHLGFAVVPDGYPDGGPLGGILSALEATSADWNLIVACDMPALTAVFLGRLFDAAEGSGADCLLPAGPSGLVEPLCAVWRRTSGPVLRVALDLGVRKITDALEGLAVSRHLVAEPHWFKNLNTPHDLAVLARAEESPA